MDETLGIVHQTHRQKYMSTIKCLSTDVSNLFLLKNLTPR